MSLVVEVIVGGIFRKLDFLESFQDGRTSFFSLLQIKGGFPVYASRWTFMVGLGLKGQLLLKKESAKWLLGTL